MVTEFQFLENIRAKYALDKIEDDCAVLPKDAETDLLVTADMLVEDVDFKLEWGSPEFLGHKALVVSLSDVAAMGGKPTWAMLSIGVPESIWNTDFIDRFYQGWHALAGETGVELVGGDVSRTPEKLVIDSVVGGEVAKGKAILRSGAKAGDAIFVTGTLGAAAGGLKLLERGFEILDDLPDLASNLLIRHLKPEERSHLATQLQETGVITSMIDISDGLSSDLAHLCRQSGVGATIQADKLPIEDDLNNYFHTDLIMEMVLDGGEDFELLFTVSEKNISAMESLPVTRIGEVTANVGNIELIRNGETHVLAAKGYQHF